MDRGVKRGVSPFGLLADMSSTADIVRYNIRIAASNIYTIRVAAESGELDKIPNQTLVQMLKESEAALDAISSI